MTFSKLEKKFLVSSLHPQVPQLVSCAPRVWLLVLSASSNTLKPCKLGTVGWENSQVMGQLGKSLPWYFTHPLAEEPCVGAGSWSLPKGMFVHQDSDRLGFPPLELSWSVAMGFSVRTVGWPWFLHQIGLIFFFGSCGPWSVKIFALVSHNLLGHWLSLSSLLLQLSHKYIQL